jgi:PTH1 family peptidyl-tRNA hydrolase
MNLSGEAIKAFISFYKLSASNMLIISDDLDQELGNFKLKQNGTSGGHNGLKNIELNLGTINYNRLKIGIANNKNMETKDYVLGSFSKEEKEILDSIIKLSENIIADYLKFDFAKLMNKYNGLNKH